MTHQMQNILVTGGAGFIGSNFIHYLQKKQSQLNIINLDKLTYAGSLDNLADLPQPDKHTFVQGDICDQALVRKLMQDHHIDTIIHFAAESHVDRSIDSPQSFVETNVLGTFTLLECAREYWGKRQDVRFHHISTDEVFGSLYPGDAAFTEETPYQPRSPYSATKAGSDHLVNAYFHTYGMPITISNCSNNYGPRQHQEKLIPTVIRACLSGEKIPVYGQGKNIRDWLYVDDHCEAIVDILANGKTGGTYNIGGKNEWENLALVKSICQSIDKLAPQAQACETLITFVTDRPGHDFRYAINNSKIQTELKWEPKWNIESGLEATILYYLNLTASINS